MLDLIIHKIEKQKNLLIFQIEQQIFKIKKRKL